MYEILVKEQGLLPTEAADRIYKDLAGIWQKDTIRRLIPPEAKNQVARERQALSRCSLLVNKAGIILRTADIDDNSKMVIIKLEKENARLRNKAEDLNTVNRSQLARILQLEKSIAISRQEKGRGAKKEEQEATMIMLPPHLFMKAFTLMRSCMKPLVLKVEGKEVIDIDRNFH